MEEMFTASIKNLEIQSKQLKKDLKVQVKLLTFFLNMLQGHFKMSKPMLIC